MDKYTVSTQHGKVSGICEDGVMVWKGIPYAKAPVGDLRFRLPVAPDNWDGALSCNKFSAQCPQPALPFGGAPMEESEDCLYLNVWSADTEGKKPVYFWINGGNFVSGSGAEATYDGKVFARQGIVEVTFNYRLGVFGGFYDLSEYNALKGKYDLNCGIADCKMALEWVKNNITAFGGDPDNITIGGESAGAQIVAALMTDPEVSELFSKAIIESYPASGMKENARKQFADVFMSSLGLDHESAADLIEKTPEEILEGIGKFSGGSPLGAGTNLIYGGSDFPLFPEDAASTGHITAKPLLIGTNAGEGNVMFHPQMPWNEGTKMFFNRWVRAEGDPDDNPEYTSYPDYPAFTALRSIITDKVFREPSLKIAASVAGKAPVYVYQFDYATPAAIQSGMGAFHSFEMSFVFGNIAGNPMFAGAEDAVASVSAEMNTVWSKFIKEGRTGWDQYTGDERSIHHFAG